MSMRYNPYLGVLETTQTIRYAITGSNYSPRARITTVNPGLPHTRRVQTTDLAKDAQPGVMGPANPGLSLIGLDVAKDGQPFVTYWKNFHNTILR